MPNPLNVPITPPRVAFIDSRTGTVSREWYMFFLSLFQLTGGSNVSLDDLQKSPPIITVDEINVIVDKASENLRPSTESTVEQIAELRKQIEALEVQVRPELGTMSQIQQANVPWQTFDTTPESLPTDIGTVAWDGGTTLGIQMTANVLQPVGEAQYFYIKADSTITKGQLIMFTGAVGASGVIRGAPATGLTDGQYLMGIAAENIATNGFGLVTSFGHVRGWNTTGAPVGETWADGDILYYNPSVAGGLTKTQPTAPNVKATVAVVVNAAPAGSGDVFVRVSSGSVLGGTDSNVQFGTLANGDLIQYDSTLGYWKNVAASSILSGGTADGVLYINASNVVTSGTTLVFNGTNLGVGIASPNYRLNLSGVQQNTGGGANTIPALSTTLVSGEINGSLNDATDFGLLRLSAGGRGGSLGTKSAIDLQGFGSTDNSQIRFYTAGSERARLSNAGNFGIGVASPNYRLNLSGVQQNIGGGANTIPALSTTLVNGEINGSQNDATDFGLLRLSAGGRGGSINTKSAIDLQGFGSTDNSQIRFYTAGSERARITNAGSVVAGGSAALATTATDGFLYVPTCAGTPTGAPTAITGMAPIVVDTTNNKLYFYSGGAWRDAGP